MLYALSFIAIRQNQVEAMIDYAKHIQGYVACNNSVHSNLALFIEAHNIDIIQQHIDQINQRFQLPDDHLSHISEIQELPTDVLNVSGVQVGPSLAFDIPFR